MASEAFVLPAAVSRGDVLQAFVAVRVRVRWTCVFFSTPLRHNCCPTAKAVLTHRALCSTPAGRTLLCSSPLIVVVCC